MDEELRQALAKVPDAYYDFVDGYYRDFRGDVENQKKLLEYLANNPEARTDDVIEYIDDVLLA